MNTFWPRMLNRVHRGILVLSRGRIGWTIRSMPVLELHTIGRSTGARRTVLLSAPVRDGDRFVLVASQGGAPQHPQWYLNLVANPDVELTVQGRTLPMRARTAGPKDRSELWPKIVQVYPGYAKYQRRTTREIPVVICEPRAAETRTSGQSG